MVAFGVCELCWGRRASRTPLALLMLVYFAIQLVGMSLYGVEPWTRRADAFGVVLRALRAPGRPGPPRRGALRCARRWSARRGCPRSAGVVALLVVAIGVTAFDGAKEGPLFNDAGPGGRRTRFIGLGFAPGLALELGFVARAGGHDRGDRRDLRARGRRDAGAAGRRRAGLGRRFAHTLVPIAAAYVVAHYFSLLAYQGQDVLRLLSDPLGEGADLLGTADRPDRLHGRDGDGHLVRAGRSRSSSATWPRWCSATTAPSRSTAAPRAAVGSQVVMLVLMVCFTCLGLYLLSVANA